MGQRSEATRYRGRRTEAGCIIERLTPETIPGRRSHWAELSPLKSLRAFNHSPDGFEWGYGGSGPAQTALALLLDFTGDKKLAIDRHQAYKFAIVARLSDNWEITGAEIAASIA